MRLPIKPLPFFAKLIVFFALTYAGWGFVAPAYTRLLVHATRGGVWLSELSFDPAWRAQTTIIPRDSNIFYVHPRFAKLVPPLDPQGIPAEWVMANLVLLIPLMLATPASTWKVRFTRFALALLLALAAQVVDVVVTIKAFYSTTFPGHWGPFSRSLYGFLDAFFQGFDTQLFPFAIWAGIHFRMLVVPAQGTGGAPATPLSGTRAERRRAIRKGVR